MSNDLGPCRSCGATVAFIRQPSGKVPPFNVDALGLVRLDAKGRPESHFATCAQASSWRGKAKAHNGAGLPAAREGDAAHERHLGGGDA